MAEHPLRHFGTGKKRIDSRAGTGRIRQDADKVGKSLLGDLRTANKRRIRKIKAIPLMQRQIIGPLGRFGQRGGDIRQAECSCPQGLLSACPLPGPQENDGTQEANDGKLHRHTP